MKVGVPVLIGCAVTLIVFNLWHMCNKQKTSADDGNIVNKDLMKRVGMAVAVFFSCVYVNAVSQAYVEKTTKIADDEDTREILHDELFNRLPHVQSHDLSDRAISVAAVLTVIRFGIDPNLRVKILIRYLILNGFMFLLRSFSIFVSLPSIPMKIPIRPIIIRIMIPIPLIFCHIVYTSSKSIKTL